MPKFEQIRDRLPSLYRPQIGDTSLMTRLLESVGQLLDQTDTEAALVLQSHWFPYADRALHDPFYRRGLELAEQPVPTANDPSLLTFPYIDELAYLGSLLALAPWQDPVEVRESSEAYRLRIRRMVALYRKGLGTIGAIERVVEANLPVDLGLPESLRDRTFWIEESVPFSTQTLQAQSRGTPEGLVGPLMRWSVNNSGHTAVIPTLYIQGIKADAEELSPTEQPVIERYQGSGAPLGLAYTGSLAADETLRIRPAFNSWLGTDTGLLKATALPTADEPANPTAPGPWSAVDEGPTGRVVAIATAEDNTLWTATNEGDSGLLWRYDGQTWSNPIDTNALGQIHCLQMNGQDLWIGANTGLRKLPLFPADGTLAFSPTLLESVPVYAIQKDASQFWLGTENGLFVLRIDETPDGVIEPTAIQNLPVYALLIDAGVLYLGNRLGLMQYQIGADSWSWYSGEQRSDQQPEWISFQPTTDSLPTDEQVFLPPVRSLARSADNSLWIGTERGLARYVARSSRGLAYETILEAFLDLTTGSVPVMKIDERGLLWIGTDRGLLRYDGRNLSQFQNGNWLSLGKANRLYPEGQASESREGWRFNRALDTWERFEAIAPPPLRTTNEPAVNAIAWTSTIIADLGKWDGTNFQPNNEGDDENSVEVDISQLETRYKPRPTQIITGGPPTIPTLPTGTSIWRYLQRESNPPSEPTERPAWTHEGRLLPPPPENAIDPESGRYDVTSPPPSDFDSSIFAFDPAARVWLQWPPSQPRSALVRLSARTPNEQLDPTVVDRLWQQIQIVKPVGVQIQLALEESILKGNQ